MGVARVGYGSVSHSQRCGRGTLITPSFRLFVYIFFGIQFSPCLSPGLDFLGLDSTQD